MNEPLAIVIAALLALFGSIVGGWWASTHLFLRPAFVLIRKSSAAGEWRFSRELLRALVAAANNHSSMGTPIRSSSSTSRYSSALKSSR